MTPALAAIYAEADRLVREDEELVFIGQQLAEGDAAFDTQPSVVVDEPSDDE